MMEQKLKAHKEQQAQWSKSSASFPHKAQAQDENVSAIKQNGIKMEDLKSTKPEAPLDVPDQYRD